MKCDVMIRNGGLSHVRDHHRRHHGRCDESTTDTGIGSVQLKMTDTDPYSAEIQGPFLIMTSHFKQKMSLRCFYSIDMS